MAGRAPSTEKNHTKLNSRAPVNPIVMRVSQNMFSDWPQRVALFA
jgi:hypothetical protein